MKNKQSRIITIIQGVLLVTFGVLIAAFGGAKVLDAYLGIVAIISGAAFLVLACYGLIKTKELDITATLLAPILLAIGIAPFTGFLSFAAILDLLVLALMGLGFGLVLYGVYSLIKGLVFMGIGEMVVGALLITFTFLFIYVNEFKDVFWIIVGVILAAYGLVKVIAAIINKESKAEAK